MNLLPLKSLILPVLFVIVFPIVGNASELLAYYPVDGDANGVLTDRSKQSPPADGNWSASKSPTIESGVAGFEADLLKYQDGSNAAIILEQSTGSGRLATDFSAEGGFSISLRVSVTSLEDTPPLEFIIGRWNSGTNYRSFLLGLIRNANEPQGDYTFIGIISTDSSKSIAVRTVGPIVVGGVYDLNFVYTPGESISISALGINETADLESGLNSQNIPDRLFLTSEGLPDMEPIRIGGSPGVSSFRNGFLDSIKLSANIAGAGSSDL